jgi:hypothetical protein
MIKYSMNRQLVQVLFACFLIAFMGCTRTAGEGGVTTITGNVEIEQRIVITNPLSAIVVPAIDQDVYITYGDRVGPDDRVRTNYDGDFAFYGLRPGDYTIYVYSEDTMPTSNNAPDVAIIQQVTIEKGDETLELEPIRIYEDI